MHANGVLFRLVAIYPRLLSFFQLKCTIQLIKATYQLLYRVLFNEV